MEVKALCRLLVNVFLLHVQAWKCHCAGKAGAGFPLLQPNRLQFFEFKPIQVKCEGLDVSSEWRVMKKRKEDHTNVTEWKTSTGSMTISLPFTRDSGEYWCENEEGERSNSVNITVTDGDVILESPVVPVMEGDSVSLNCKKKMAALNLAAEFFKDGSVIPGYAGYKGYYTINNVSKSDEGFYKCSISGAGESPESWLAVRDAEIQDITETPSPDDSPHRSMVVPVVLTVLFVAGLLLSAGLLLCWKYKVGCFSSVTSTPREDLVSEGTTVAASGMPTYAVVHKFQKKKGPSISSCSADRTVSSTDQEVLYSTIHPR